MELRTGIYETLIYQALERQINNLPDNIKGLKLDIDTAEAPKLLTGYVSNIIIRMLSDDDVFESLDEKVEFVNRLIKFIESDKPCFNSSDDIITIKDKLLSAVIDCSGKTEKQIELYNKFRPSTGFTSSSLFTGANDGLRIADEIKLDILSADEIYWIVAFIRFSGVRIFEEQLRKFLGRPSARLYIITTSYMGASEPKAVEWLRSLSPDKVKIKVNYDINSDRLHAKSYIFVRNSGLSTAYIGSSNMSHSALSQGLEWNIRVTNEENPQIIKTARAAFETYWHRADFEDYDAVKFAHAIVEAGKPFGQRGRMLPTFTVRPEQKSILDMLTVERKEHGSFRNLVVAATGTGKTVIAAFDYRRFAEQNTHSRLLFIAHREEILEQSRRTFAAVLGKHDFGELWVGQHRPSEFGNLDHLFISIQTFNNQKELFKSFGPKYYDFIIIDECHHSQAGSYRALFDIFEPEILLGLTATPERADGKSLLPDFNNRIAAEMRLPEAINRMLLSPFQYFCIGDDTVSLANVSWRQGSYDENELFNALNTAERMRLITETLPKYLADENNCRALCFCIRKTHARDVAEGLRMAGYKADYLTGDDSEEHRKQVLDNFRSKKINYLCVVDLLNEGVDIPEIDTVLFLRPTKSLTIFLQQLGRGLRLAPDKECLTVLDYVARANANYSYESRIRALTGREHKNLKDEVANGFSFLPRGCSINLDKLSKQYIFDNIKNSIFNIRRLETEVRNYGLNFDDGLTLMHFIHNFDIDIRTVYKTTCWSALKKRAGIADYKEDKFTSVYERNIKQTVHWNDINIINFVRQLINDKFTYEHTADNCKYALILYYALYGKSLRRAGLDSVDEALNIFGSHLAFVDELSQIMECLADNIKVSTQKIKELGNNPLALFGCYTRMEQLIMLDVIKETDNPGNPMAGIYNIENLNTELLWVTLNKSDRDFSPNTQYNDYAINEKLFHWQSQNMASHYNSGRRYVEQRTNGRKFLLFVREKKKDAFGFTEPYYCLGLVDYVSSEGDRPMNIVWRMHDSIPGFILDKAEKLAVG